MIFSAAAGHGVFLEAPPARRGLARVENFGARSFYQIGKLRGGGGDAGKALNKIQRDAFGAQERAAGTGNFQERRTGLHALAVAGKFLDLDFGRQLAKGEFSERQTGNGERLTGVHERDGLRIHGDSGKRGHVATAEVFGERGADGAADFCGGKFHADKMTAHKKRKSKMWKRTRQIGMKTRQGGDVLSDCCHYGDGVKTLTPSLSSIKVFFNGQGCSFTTKT